MTSLTDWRGEGRTGSNRIEFIAEHNFMFGGKTIVAGSIVKQWETKNWGWTSWRTPGGTLMIAKE